MKRLKFFTAFILLSCVLCFCACSHDEEEEPTLPPTRENLLGVWEITKYIRIHGPKEERDDYVKIYTEDDRRFRWKLTPNNIFYYLYEVIEPEYVVAWDGEWGAPDFGVGRFRIKGDTIITHFNYKLSNGKSSHHVWRDKVLRLTKNKMEVQRVNRYLPKLETYRFWLKRIR